MPRKKTDQHNHTKFSNWSRILNESKKFAKTHGFKSVNNRGDRYSDAYSDLRNPALKPLIRKGKAYHD